MRLCCSPLPLASAISGVCPKAREQAQGRGRRGGCGLGLMQSKRPGSLWRSCTEPSLRSQSPGCGLGGSFATGRFQSCTEGLVDHQGSRSCPPPPPPSTLTRRDRLSLGNSESGRAGTGVEASSWNGPFVHASARLAPCTMVERPLLLMTPSGEGTFSEAGGLPQDKSSSKLKARCAVRRGRGEESGGRPARLGRAGELDSLPRLVPQGLSSGVA